MLGQHRNLLHLRLKADIELWMGLLRGCFMVTLQLHYTDMEIAE